MIKIKSQGQDQSLDHVQDQDLGLIHVLVTEAVHTQIDVVVIEEGDHIHQQRNIRERQVETIHQKI
jgi:hypothetical protein